jgi:hypothetical protein
MSTRLELHNAPVPSRARAAWPLERVLFAMAGTVTLLAALLAATLSPWWLLLSAFAGVNQLAFVAFGDCAASIVLRRVFGLERGCER